MQQALHEEQVRASAQRKKMKVLLSPVGLYLGVGNVLTNMHTCLYGSIVNNAFGMEKPDLDEYMAGGPYSS